jgi:hypothetical protein
MSDRYDKIRDNAKFRRDQAEKMGVGFELPKNRNGKTKSRKFVVRRVVPPAQ